LTGTPTTGLQRMLLGWFGFRSREVADMTISIVAASIVVYGLTSQPLMAWYDRSYSKRSKSKQPADSPASA
jgi:hypothetical protein